jgi:hypothetical protein
MRSELTLCEMKAVCIHDLIIVVMYTITLAPPGVAIIHDYSPHYTIAWRALRKICYTEAFSKVSRKISGLLCCADDHELLHHCDPSLCT